MSTRSSNTSKTTQTPKHEEYKSLQEFLDSIRHEMGREDISHVEKSFTLFKALTDLEFENIRQMHVMNISLARILAQLERIDENLRGNSST